MLPTIGFKTQETEQKPLLAQPDNDMAVEAGTQPMRLYSSQVRRAMTITSHSLVFVITSIIWLSVLFAMGPTPPTSTPTKTSAEPAQRHNVTSNARLITCGNSTLEARALGCKYDVLLNNWVPEQCVDTEFVEEYKEDRSWAAFADEAMTQELTSIDEMSDRDHYYTSTRDHVNHCVVVWKKQFWTLFEEARAFDSVIMTPYHTDHCTQYLMNVAMETESRATKVTIGFAGCWIKE